MNTNTKKSSADQRKQIDALISQLKSKGKTLSTKRVTAGFDGFIDTITRVIKDKPGGRPPLFFKTKHAFGHYINGKEGSSFSLEWEVKNIRVGGNMPIMANALGGLGVMVNCIGAFGLPQINPVFKTLSSNCQLHSFAEPGTSTAIEFGDGKILLGNMGDLNRLGWQEIKKRIGIKKIIDCYRESDLFCLVNWAEIDASTDIWRGIISDVLPRYKQSAPQQLAFFDLSDCSKRGRNSIRQVLELLKVFSRHSRVMVGLNHNEARLVYKALFPAARSTDLSAMGAKIFHHLDIHTLVLHSPAESIALDEEGVYHCNSFFTRRPKISTGAGDNFNAGFCAGRLMDLGADASLLLAHTVSGIYIRTGASPQLKEIIYFLEYKR